MAQEIRQYTFDIPVTATQSAPATLDMTFPPREVERIEIIVPPGPNGLVGFQLQNSGLVVIPYDSDQWIITNDEKISWDTTGFINSGSWQVAGYNIGTKTHSVYVRFLLNLVNQAPAPAAPIGADLDVLSNLDALTGP